MSSRTPYSKAERTQWFADARYGFFFHFLNPHHMTAEHSSQNFPWEIGEWNKQVDSFDVDLFAEQLAELSAGYVFLTVGQNSGYYCAPNQTYDAILGEKRCSDRDLISDFATSLAKYDIPLLVYTTGLSPYLDRLAVEKLECVPPWHTLCANAYERYTDLIHNDPRQISFQRKWNAIHEEWSRSWGEKVKGWWVDGVHCKEMYCFPDEPNGHSFAAALRSGNPRSILAFNGGCTTEPSAAYPEEEDYTAGEMNTPIYGIKPGPLVDGLRYHLLSFTGSAWWTGPVRISGENMAEITRMVNDNGGVMTWDLPFSAGKGIDEDVLAQLKIFVSSYNESLHLFPETSVAITPPQIAPDSSPVYGKVHLESASLAGTLVNWNGQEFLCGDDSSCMDLELPPVEPAGELKVTRNGLSRTYPVTTVRKFTLSEQPCGPFEIYSDPPAKNLLGSYTLALKKECFVLDAVIYESSITAPEDVTRLCSSNACSNTILFFYTKGERSEIYLRPDGNIFRIEDRIITAVKDVELTCTQPENGSYSLRAVIPLSVLPSADGEQSFFRLNIAQHIFREGKHFSGMLFGGENKNCAPGYDAAVFTVAE